MRKTTLKKKILIPLAVVMLSAMLAISTIAMVGDEYHNYGEIAKTDRFSMVLDAEKDAAYNAATSIPIEYQSYNSKGEGLAWYPRENGEAPASGEAYIVSDSSYLWVYVEVIDETLNTFAPDAISGKYTEDSVEILIDWANKGNKNRPYQMRVSHEGYISARIGQNGTTLQGTEAQGSTNPVKFFDGTAKHTENGYVCEFKIDIPVYEYGDMIGENISLGIFINDYDSTGELGSRVIVSSDPVNGTNQWIADNLGYATLEFNPYSGICGENLTWSFDAETGTLDIAGEGAMYDFEKAYVPWCTYFQDITEINIGNGVTYIGEYAFYGCESLTSIVIPESVEGIGEFAFLVCNRLVEVINHSNLNLVAGSSKNGKVSYHCLEVHDGESKVVVKDGFKFYPYNGVNYLCDYIGDKTSLVLPESYYSGDYVINQYAFKNKNIVEVFIPETVKSIGERAFSYCQYLKKAEISNGVSYMGKGAFEGCSNLVSIEIPKSVQYIGRWAFDFCSSLDKVVIKSAEVEIFDDWHTIYPTATIYGYEGSSAEAYAEKYHCAFIPINSVVKFESKENINTDTFTVDVYFENMPEVKSFIIKDFVYDTESITLVDADINVDGLIVHWDIENHIATVSFETATDCNGAVLTLNFEVNDSATKNVEVSANTVVVKTMNEDGAEVSVGLEIETGKIELFSIIRGDVNGDRIVNSDDAIYLLRYTLLPEEYPVDQDADMDGNGLVGSDDAIYLLRHILAPEIYPIG